MYKIERVILVNVNSVTPKWNQRVNTQSFQILSNFLRDQATNTRNLMFSPLSIYISLGMLNEGMRDEASKQLNDYFGFNSQNNFNGGLEESVIKSIKDIFSIK